MKSHRFNFPSAPRCRSEAERKRLQRVKSQLKLSSMPFEVITALSRDPELLRQWSRLGLGILLLVAGVATAQENPPPAPPVTNVVSVTTTVVAREANTVVVTTNVATTPAVSTNAPAAVSATSGPVKPPAPITPVNPKPGSAAAANSYEAFKIVSDRNIFNPNRYPSRSRGGPVEAPKPQPRVESFALVGTISYDKGSFAFFDSNSSSYRKTLKAGDTIASYKLKEVAQSHVMLEADGKDTELKVGMQMRREDEGPWQASARSESFASSSGSSGSSTSSQNSGSSDSNSASASAGSGGGGASELLKRLMEQRMKEQNK